MNAFEIRGGKPLSGTIVPQGAKNEALQVLCAALLTDDVPPDAYADSGFMAFLKQGPQADSDDQAADSISSKP